MLGAGRRGGKRGATGVSFCSWPDLQRRRHPPAATATLLTIRRPVGALRTGGRGGRPIGGVSVHGMVVGADCGWWRNGRD